ncbi:bifunctional alpha,alpha-trehalose-phosphate synthase (UDP-forming)/trehalose-phosphatase [Pseudoflavitalea sp. G-6-1-2]|uniref:bifunctional alpha,alpha-trehalose-phosphate synthase (UDP-forming)/trehalose-phosphatase n=1 Tax=Pseudoflavitalea sp. G-6-1-2 TaxID=2728841 RepID=UPI00146A09D6|nr:bifunctional alpha,alpha-trehalose-phosphate synthase (UDP-forming)/trehalose-phosphatase [Pseudoflavitalea sp. G-6-1-2]NML21453.1 bifunctional alpha,alpha-trehalose-phosphate synthase (UDP-forming)/trehalose-phosphatase [Pseudoflavitalea sp. G-6-1-2]
MARLIIISNRLPFSVDREGDQVTIRQSSGGLVSAIKSYFESDTAQNSHITEKLWMGVADFSKEDFEQEVVPKLDKYDFTAVPLFTDKTVYKDYYNGFSNSTLWPLFHYFPSLVEYQSDYFDAYTKVNAMFAETLLPMLKPDDIIWIHDYQLMLLPGMIRAQQPKATIGFFLHIPFPSYEIFRMMPTDWKMNILRGVLGADLVGFHTYDYVEHFVQSVRMVVGADSNFRSIQYQNRLVKADLFPIGIDYKKFQHAAKDPEVQQLRDEVQQNFAGKKIIFSVDRLDYTKGLMDRLNGFEYFLTEHPEWQDRVVFVLNVVPSRDDIQAYTRRKRTIEEKISGINGKFSSISWQPVIYRYMHLPFNELSALYQTADVALITPLRDGMNLVAKEYIASTVSQKGVLILSELAGAASELSEALLVNPTDVKDVSNAIVRALNMPVPEQKQRMALMQKRLSDYDVINWVNDFLDQLNNVKTEQAKQQTKLMDDKIVEQMHQAYQKAKKRCLLLDYDGTLVPFARLPQEAMPGKDLLGLLKKMAADKKNNVVIISGREGDTLENWLGKVPLTLVAEHGASFKMKEGDWQFAAPVSDTWKEEIRPVMQTFVTRCVGSFVEEKTNTIAWHYRNTHPDLGFVRSRELINNLNQLLQNTLLQVIDGNKVVEVRMSGFDKGVMARKLVQELDPDFVLCIGDDTTDEDMFKALGDKAYTIKVSHGPTAAQFTVLSQQNVLPLLEELSQPLTKKQYAGS